MRGGYNWADRYPWIVEAARKIRVKQFVINGEAVVLGIDASLNRKIRRRARDGGGAKLSSRSLIKLGVPCRICNARCYSAIE